MKFFSLIIPLTLVSVVILANTLQNYHTVKNARISGGDVAPRADYAFVVSLQILDGIIWKHYCGGSIVSSQKILTAASCFTDFDDRKLHRIVAGSSNLKRFELRTRQIKFFRVSSVKIHPKFDRNTKDFNFAVIRTRSPLRFTSFVKQVELSSISPVPIDTECLTAGWGQTTYRSPSALLRNVSINTTFALGCKTEYMNSAGLIINGPLICAGGKTTGPPSQMPTKNGICFGDIGGPLICEERLQGVASFFYGPCDSKFLPDVFGDVGEMGVNQWIMSP